MQEANDEKPERVYTIAVTYSLHCFTRGPRPEETADPSLHYSDGRETRIFDFQRYQLSLQLPRIVENLPSRKCYHTGRGNFFTVDLIDDRAHDHIQYEVYFAVSRSSPKGVLNLYVQSAYVRDPQHKANQPQRKAIRFGVVLFNIASNIEIKVPK